MKNYFFASLLIILSLGERIWFDLGPNVELITMTMLLSAVYLKRQWSLIITAVVIGISDLVLGNTNIILFTWSAWLFCIIGTKAMLKFLSNTNSGWKIFCATSIGIASNTFFYIWTNFGVWYLDAWGMYANDISGLLMSYINGLPFFKMQLISTLIFVPASFQAVESAKYLLKNVKIRKPVLAVIKTLNTK